MEPRNAPARWWLSACLKCISGWRRLEKTLNFLRCIHVFDLVLKSGSDINEGNWLQVLFYFIVLMAIVTAVNGIRFFSAVFHVLDWGFLQLHSDGNVCNRISKVIWSRMDWFWRFFLGTGFFHWLHIWMDWNLQELLNCYYLLKTSIFFVVQFEGFSGLFFKNALIVLLWDFVISIDKFQESNATLLSIFLCLAAYFSCK